jgi:hypothetical protein
MKTYVDAQTWKRMKFLNLKLDFQPNIIILKNKILNILFSNVIFQKTQLKLEKSCEIDHE